jgi:hypothetical protein
MSWKHPHSPTTGKLKIEPYVRKTLVTVCGIVKASCCVNFSHQKQSAATDTVKLKILHQAIK